MSAGVVLAGAWGAIALAGDATQGGRPSTVTPSPAASASAPAATTAIPAPDPSAAPIQLAGEAQQLQQAGEVNAAVVRYRLAVRGLPDRADIRTALGVALAESGSVADGIRQLRRAARRRPVFADARLYLGAVLLRAGQDAEGRRQVRRYLRQSPSPDGQALARQLLAGGSVTR